MAESFDNKYRPRRLSEIIGQPSIVTTIGNSIESGNLHHSYLFAGQFGTGKSTLSRLLAAMVNCVKGPTVSPCGECVQCKAIFASKHSDVIEIDAASGGKIDEVREMKKTIYYAPVFGARKKFYIFEECLPYNSEIMLENGKVKIGELVEKSIGNNNISNVKVKGYDIDDKKEIYQKIKRYIKIPNDKQMYEIKIQDENGSIRTINITGNHKVFANGEYVLTSKLKNGDEVVLEKEGDIHLNGV